MGRFNFARFEALFLLERVAERWVELFEHLESIRCQRRA